MGGGGIFNITNITQRFAHMQKHPYICSGTCVLKTHLKDKHRGT